MLFSKTKKLNDNDLLAFNNLNNLLGQEKYKAILIQNNTAVIPMGRQVMRQQEAIVALVEQGRDDWIRATLSKYEVSKGIKVKIDGKTGEITEAGPSDDILKELELKQIQEKQANG